MTQAPQLVLDQGCPASTAILLREAGWNVVHLSELGMIRATDAEIIEWASREHRIVVTLDADFHALLAIAQSSRPSVIRIRKQGLNGKALAKLLLDAWPIMATALDSGSAVTITEGSVRFRHLPLGSAS